ncbi:hypothetical protein KRP22_006501 [Phytophthora ramorum]|nr:hypothetical protein KRP22_2369 [Phytophthora ramorum]
MAAQIVIRSQFVIQAQLHATLFGDIWICRDLQNDNQLVAVKQVRLDLARQALAHGLVLDSPWDERRTLDTLLMLGPHDNVLQTYQHFQQDDSWDVTRDFEAAIPLPISNKICEAICAVLGNEWTGQDGRLPRQGHCFLVATAGIKGDDATRCCSGTLVVKVYPATGAYVLQYASSATYGGGRMTSYRAVRLGLLRGLRRCRAYRWASIHVRGDNADVLRRLTSRTPPRAIHLKGDSAGGRHGGGPQLVNPTT